MAQKEEEDVDGPYITEFGAGGRPPLTKISFRSEGTREQKQGGKGKRKSCPPFPPKRRLLAACIVELIIESSFQILLSPSLQLRDEGGMNPLCMVTYWPTPLL